MYIMYAHTIDLVSIDPVVITLDNILDGGVGVGVGVTDCVEVVVEVGVEAVVGLDVGTSCDDEGS